MPDLDRDTPAATDGELLARRAAYQLQAAWASPHVLGEFREAHLAEDSSRTGAILARHHGNASTGDSCRR